MEEPVDIDCKCSGRYILLPPEDCQANEQLSPPTHFGPGKTVIQPTPILSPCGSEGTLYDRPVSMPSGSPAVSVGMAVATVSGLSVPKMAPLASISSCAVSASSDVDAKSIASDCRSIGSDSVFLDEDCIDTEDEAEEFSTDSDNDNNNNIDNNGIYGSHSDLCTTPSVPFAEHLQVCRYPRTLAGRWHNVSGPVCRRYSSPGSRKLHADTQLPSCSKSCDTFVDGGKIYSRPPIPLPQSDDDDDDTLSDSDTINNDQQEKPDDAEYKQQQSTSFERQQSRSVRKVETENDNKRIIEVVAGSSLFTKKEKEETEKEENVGDTTTEEVEEAPRIVAPSEFSELSLVQSQPITSASCDHLVKALTEKSKILSSSMKDIVEHCSSWSQETLF